MWFHMLSNPAESSCLLWTMLTTPQFASAPRNSNDWTRICLVATLMLAQDTYVDRGRDKDKGYISMFIVSQHGVIRTLRSINMERESKPHPRRVGVGGTPAQL